jgi:4-aminobutyrate aminotransferase-like enzyme
MPGTAGQVVLADGFLAGAYERVRAAGGVCIADEVQIGVGRPGEATWGFELHGVVPDVVTMGKPLGNGHPLAAVVTTPEIAASFATGMEYFNTFGGNPVSARVGLAVLDVVADERLQQRAAVLGERMLAGLRELAERHELVGDVRGTGLFVGVQLVADRSSRAPAGAAAAAVVEEVKARGVLISSDGPDHDVLKVKPPMVLTEADVDRFVTALDEALTAVGRS